MPCEVVAQRQVRQRAGGLAVEAQRVLQHAPEAGTRQVALLREQRGEVRPGPFEVGIDHADGEGHVAGDGVDLQFAEQRGQVRVGTVVEHQEAGIHREMRVLQLHFHRVSVPT